VPRAGNRRRRATCGSGEKFQKQPGHCAGCVGGGARDGVTGAAHSPEAPACASNEPGQGRRDAGARRRPPRTPQQFIYGSAANPVNPTISSPDQEAATKAPDSKAPFSSPTDPATPSQSASGKVRSTGAIVGISVGLAGAMLLVGAAIVLLLRRRKHGSGAQSAKLAHPSGTEHDTESLKDLQIQSSQGSPCNRRATPHT
jgi:LPXTG-motif cell wall-anchored protein